MSQNQLLQQGGAQGDWLSGGGDLRLEARPQAYRGGKGRGVLTACSSLEVEFLEGDTTVKKRGFHL